MFLIHLVFLFLFPQQNEQIWLLSYKLKIDATSIYTDVQKNIYCLSMKGEINRYDSLLRENTHFSSAKLMNPTHIETWNRLGVMLFYEENQQLTFLNRFLQIRNEYNFSDSKGAFFTAATYSTNGTVWAFDASNLRLVRIDLLTNQLLFEWFLNDLDYYPEITFLREYENFLFALDAQRGILIFDLVGQLVKEVNKKNLKEFKFYQNTGYYLLENKEQIQIIDLFSDNDEVIDLPEKAHSVVYLGKMLYLLNTKNELCIYKKR